MVKLPFDTKALAVSLRFVAVGFLVLVLGVPLALVSCVADERKAFRDTAVAKVAQSFGRAQRLAGPVIVIPLVQRVEADNNTMREQFLFVMPERLSLRLETRHDLRPVGIFKVPTLTANVTAEGEFPPLDVEALAAAHGTLRLERATIGFGVSDARGILDAALRWDEAELPLEPGSGPMHRGLGTALANPAAGGAFALQVELRGTGRFSTVPVGDRSFVTMRSTWPHPSFDGRFLPEMGYEISDAGFRATWRTTELARGYPGEVVATHDGFFNHRDLDLGFSVFEPVNLYVLVSRSVKYGVLFVALTLVSVLCLELSTGRRFHIVQYGVGGLGLTLFFLTLLALSEHLGFRWAYLGASVLLTGMIGCYVYGAAREGPLTALAVGMLAALYGVLFVLLQLEDFALLVGVGVLLVALAMLMWVTRRLTPPAQADADAD